MKRLPKARITEIVERDLDKELLIYDLTTHKAYTLNETSKIVFKACDGRQTFGELKEKHQFTDDLIHFALDQLKKQNLLADEPYVSPFVGMSRRDIIKQVGLTTMIALPIISALVVPSAAHAASGAGCINGGTLPPGAAFTDICATSTPTCDANAGGRCCSGRAVTSNVPCPINPGLNGACICAPPLA